MANDVLINIRTRGGKPAAAELGGVGKALTSIGRASQVASRGLGGATRSAGGFGRTITSWRTAFIVGGLGSIGVAAGRMGLQFNASMEQNQVAFTQFLGSSQAARRELGFLYKTAAATPFEVPQITTAARQLLAFGFNAKQANSWLGTIGDTIAGMGGGPEQIDQLVTAIGQIRSKGRLQGDELMQLSELGVVNRQRLAKDLKVSPLELMSGKANISSQRALRALQKQFNDTFGGQSAKQARTFNGQLSTLHDNLAQTLGTITRPGFTALERTVLPALGKTTDEINKTFGRKDLTFSEKFKISEADAKRNLGPLVREARREIGQLHIGNQLSAAFEKAVPRIADSAARAAPKAAGAFVHAWWDMGPWGKLFTTGLLLRRIGVFSIVGKIAAERFLARYIPTVVAGETAANAAGAGGGAAGLLGRAGAWGAAGAAAFGAGYFGTKAVGHALGVDKHFQNQAARNLHAANLRRARAQGRVAVRLANGETVYEKPADVRGSRGEQIIGAHAPAPRRRTTVEHIHIHADGRELTRVVRRVVRDEQARR